MDRRIYVVVGIAVACLCILTLYFVTKPIELTYKIEKNGKNQNLFFYEDGRLIATLSVEVQGRKLRFCLSHDENTFVKTLKLKITPDNTSEIYLLTPYGDWNTFEFHQSKDGLSSVFYARDLGLQGRGTVTLEFLISRNASIYYTVSFEIDEGFKRYVGRGEGVLKV